MSCIKCGGFCCERFCTPYSPSEWKSWSEAIKNGHDSWIDDLGKTWSASKARDQEVLKIADMLILLEVDETFIVDNEARLNGKYSYTCKHFNKETRLCDDYDNRPMMCRNYPENTGKNCSYKKCLI